MPLSARTQRAKYYHTKWSVIKVKGRKISNRTRTSRNDQSSVADVRFLEGGSVIVSHAKLIEATPTLD